MNDRDPRMTPLVREYVPARVPGRGGGGVDRDLLRSYFSHCRVVQQAAHLETDVLDPSGRSLRVPVGQMTDGTNVWPMKLQYYLETYEDTVAPDWLLAEVTKPSRPPITDADLDSILRAVRLADRSESITRTASSEEAPDPFA
jgi:hypothetical protein